MESVRDLRRDPGRDLISEIGRARVEDLLRDGELRVVGRLVDASNATLFCEVTDDGLTAACVHKPSAGERPLWDFPDGTLAHREVAAYVVSQATGWDLVPPTVMRTGPFGLGMCQLWVDAEEGVDLADLAVSDHPDIVRMVVLDAVINNADRKGGHLLPRSDGRVQGVDHGVTFSVEDKLRTLLWQFAGQPCPSEVLDRVRSLRSQLGADLDGPLAEELLDLLTREEVVAAASRIDRLLDSRRFPEPGSEWPPVPWPPF